MPSHTQPTIPKNEKQEKKPTKKTNRMPLNRIKMIENIAKRLRYKRLTIQRGCPGEEADGKLAGNFDRKVWGLKRRTDEMK